MTQRYSFFCDWADATESLSTEADDNGVLKNGYAINQEMELEYLMPQVGANFTFLPLSFLLRYTFGIIAIIPMYLKFFFFLQCNILWITLLPINILTRVK